MSNKEKPKIGVVIPCFKVGEGILQTVELAQKFSDKIFLIDDNCPENTGEFVQSNHKDPNLSIHIRKSNGGVGASVKDGYKLAIESGMDIIVKLDGDGQMHPELIPDLILPILERKADYAKGNRFHFIDNLAEMPKKRLIGNSVLTLLSRLSSGYWSLSDPTNGFTAISRECLVDLNLEKISDRFFFESDMLFRLNLNKAIIAQLPMKAIYKNEISNLNEISVIPEFLFKHLRNFSKRLFYDYFLRGMSVGSIELVFGAIFTIFGIVFGSINWIVNYTKDVSTPLGTIMLSTFFSLVGVQLLLSFITLDVMKEPKN